MRSQILTESENNFRVNVDGAPQLVFYKRLNPGSLFPPLTKFAFIPSAYSMAQLHRLRWQIGGAGALLLLGGFVASHLVALRFSAPVKKLALDSEENRAQRKRAEAALASTAEELERSARYSADASHQLKSPVTVFRIGLESLMAREGFKPEDLRGIVRPAPSNASFDWRDRRFASFVTHGRWTSSNCVGTGNLSQLVDEWLDDLSALPDSPDVKIEKEFPLLVYLWPEKNDTPRSSCKISSRTRESTIALAG